MELHWTKSRKQGSQSFNPGECWRGSGYKILQHRGRSFSLATVSVIRPLFQGLAQAHTGTFYNDSPYLWNLGHQGVASHHLGIHTHLFPCRRIIRWDCQREITQITPRWIFCIKISADPGRILALSKPPLRFGRKSGQNLAGKGMPIMRLPAASMSSYNSSVITLPPSSL
jgi:hypothetical protein